VICSEERYNHGVVPWLREMEINGVEDCFNVALFTTENNRHPQIKEYVTASLPKKQVPLTGGVDLSKHLD
jgi:hypothetical protein